MGSTTSMSPSFSNTLIWATAPAKEGPLLQTEVNPDLPTPFQGRGTSQPPGNVLMTWALWTELCFVLTGAGAHPRSRGSSLLVVPLPAPSSVDLRRVYPSLPTTHKAVSNQGILVRGSHPRNSLALTHIPLPSSNWLGGGWNGLLKAVTGQLGDNACRVRVLPTGYDF